MYIRPKYRNLTLALCVSFIIVIGLRIIKAKTQFDTSLLTKISKFSLDDISYLDDYSAFLDKQQVGANTEIADICQAYFESLYERNPEWILHEQISDLYHHQHPEIYEFVHRYNIYNHCFIKTPKASTNIGKAFDSLITDNNKESIENRVFPWLSRRLPIFINSAGTISIGPNSDKLAKINAIKVANDLYYDFKLYKSRSVNPELPKNFPFWKWYNELSKGKGIVITMGDKYLDLGIRLIRNLRLLGNKLPVQIVHHDELSHNSAFKLIRAATSDYVPYDDDLFQLMSENTKSYSDFDSSFPKLDLTIINASPSISKPHLFEKYNRKFLAVLFNTFEDFMLIDVDAVLFKAPSKFFDSSQYQNSGTLFYKDRNLVSQRKPYFNKFFSKLIPNIIDNILFEIPLLSSTIFEEEFFKNNHVDFMESGVVCMNKAKFFPGILMSVFLSMRKPIIDAVTGDKELFWLGQLVAGESDFSFNAHWAAATGELSTGRDQLLSREVCSTHPSHISSDNDELMWINTGAFHCRDHDETDYAKDFKQMSSRYPQSIQTFEDVKIYYKSAVTFEYIIFPPSDTDLLEMPLDLQGEPRYGFMVSTCCRGYMWCAYDHVGLGNLAEQQGILLKVPDNQRTFYNYVSKSYIKD